MKQKFLILINSFFYGTLLSTEILEIEDKNEQDTLEVVADRCTAIQELNFNQTLVIEESEIPALLKGIEEFTEKSIEELSGRSHYERFNDIRDSVRAEIEKALKKLDRTFAKSDENPLDFFEFESCRENSITSIDSESNVYSGEQELGTFAQFLDSGDIPLVDGISILEDLTELMGE